MRILFITHFFPPKYTAGTENYTHGLAHAFLDKGYEVQVVCADDWQAGATYWNGVTEDTYEGVPVNRIHLNWTRMKNPNHVLYDSHPVERWLQEFLDGFKPDLVHVTSTHSLGVGVLRAVKRAGIPLVLTLMDFWFLCPNHQLYRSNGDLCDGRTTPWECQQCLLAGSNLYHRLSKAIPKNSAQSWFWGTLAHLTVINRQRGLRGMLLDIEERKRLWWHRLPFRISCFPIQSSYALSLTNTPSGRLRCFVTGTTSAGKTRLNGKPRPRSCVLGFWANCSGPKGCMS